MGRSDGARNGSDSLSSNDNAAESLFVKDLLAISAILSRGRRVFFVIFGIIFVAGATWTILRPSEYRSTASIIPSALITDNQQQSLASTLRGFSSRLGIDLGQAGGNASRTFPAILASRDLFNALNARTYSSSSGTGLQLAEILKVKAPSAALRDEATYASFRKDVLKTAYDEVSGITTIAVVLPDPVAAADLANAVLDGLGHRLVEMKQGENVLWLGFLEDRFARTNLELASAEDSLQTFLANNRNLASPMLQIREASLRRELQVRQEVVLSVQAQLESARLESGKSLSGIAVLDAPRVPIKSMGPARTVSLLLVIVLATFGSVVAVALNEAWRCYRTWRSCQLASQ